MTTGIFKEAVDGRVAVKKLGIVGDRQADLTVHGGRDKAVYVYPECHYPTWAQELGVDSLVPSQFGENLTVTEISEDTVVIGDRYRFGGVEAVITQPRLPCFKLGIRMNDKAFPARFLHSGRLGVYLRVEAEGETGAGDTFELIERPDHGITARMLWQTVFGKTDSREDIRHCFDSLPHIDAGWQRRLENLGKR